MPISTTQNGNFTNAINYHMVISTQTFDQPYSLNSSLNERIAKIAQPFFEKPLESEEEAYKKFRDEDIETLVKLGQKSDSNGVTLNDKRRAFTDRIIMLQTRAETKDITSARKDLCELTRISHIHYRQQKELAIELLMHLLDDTPITPDNCSGMLDVILSLSNDLALPNISKEVPHIQLQLAKTISKALIRYISCYEETFVNNITKDQKKALLANQNAFKGLNAHNNTEMQYYIDLGKQAIITLRSNEPKIVSVLKTLAPLIGTTIKAIEDKDISALASAAGKTFNVLKDLITSEWSDVLIAMKNRVKNIVKTKDKITEIQIMLSNRVKSKKLDWHFFYGALDILGDILQKTHEVEDLETALFGQTIKIDVTTARSRGISLRAGAGEKELAELPLPGINDFTEFGWYVEENETAKEAQERLRTNTKNTSWWCENISTPIDKWVVKSFTNEEGKKIMGKASELFALTIKRLEKSKEGYFLLFDCAFCPGIFEKNSKEIEAIILNEKNKKKYLDDTNNIMRNPYFHRLLDKEKFERARKFIFKGMDWANIANANGNYPLIVAAENGKYEFLDMLLKKGVSCDGQDEEEGLGQNALHKAAANGHASVVKLLLQYLVKEKNIAFLNKADKNGNTALLLAAKGGYSEVCEALFKAGADSSLANNIKSNALHEAAEEGHIACVQWLIAKNILLLNSPSVYGSPLCRAARQGHNDICEALLKAGADPEVTDISRGNALHYAVMGESIEVIKRLAGYPELINSKTNVGWTPYSIADESENQIKRIEICKILKAAGAITNESPSLLTPLLGANRKLE